MSSEELVAYGYVCGPCIEAHGFQTKPGAPCSANGICEACECPERINTWVYWPKGERARSGTKIRIPTGIRHHEERIRDLEILADVGRPFPVWSS